MKRSYWIILIVIILLESSLRCGSQPEEATATETPEKINPLATIQALAPRLRLFRPLL